MNRDLPITVAKTWCHDQWKNYEDVRLMVEQLRDAPKSILSEAKFKRAQKQLIMADIKANAAEYVRILTEAAPTGEIYIDIPGADIEVRLKW